VLVFLTLPIDVLVAAAAVVAVVVPPEINIEHILIYFSV